MIEENPSGHLPALVVSSFPDCLVPACKHDVTTQQPTDQAAGDIIYPDRDSGGLGDVIDDRGHWVEWVRVVLQESKLPRDGFFDGAYRPWLDSWALIS